MDEEIPTSNAMQDVALSPPSQNQHQSPMEMTMGTVQQSIGPVSDATFPSIANVSVSSPMATEVGTNPLSGTMESALMPNEPMAQSGGAFNYAVPATQLPSNMETTQMESGNDTNIHVAVDPIVSKLTPEVPPVIHQQTPMYHPPKEDKIEMIMPKTPSEGSVKSISPSSNSSGSRSRKSSLSSKSPKAHSPGNVASPGSQGRPRKARPPPPIKDDVQHDGRNDFYCWICHREGEVLCCELCPRVFHAKCLHMQKEPEGDWYCPECEKVMEAECKETQSRAMSQLSIDQLALHLRYALQRMKTTGCEPFLEPVDTKKFNDYLDYVFHPMDLNTLEKNVKKRKYGCTEAFLSDVKWIVHNCVIYNGLQTKLTQIAKSIVKICQHEMSEIEVCPECYLNSCRKRENWFCEPCKEPHLLVWAKLQGFPHWPAKALRIDKGMVDARFFGQHDRAWIPLSGCYLMSKEMPFPVKNKKKGRGPGAKGGLDSAMAEAQHYIDNVTRKIGTFEYAPPRTPLTHMDLYRRSTGIPSSTNPNDSIIVKKEAIEEESKSSLLTSGDSVLNIKIASSDLKESLESTASPSPSKKKSKIVTTSGAHPGGRQKGKGSFGSKKQATFLQKTIASLRDSITNSDDSSSDESDSSSDGSNEDALSSNKSTPNSMTKGADDKVSENADVTSKNETRSSKKADHSDESDSELVMDIPDDEEAKKRDEKGASQKVVVKSKKSEAEKSAKPKSILLNKEPGKITETPARPTIGIASVKRKMTEDVSGAIAKARKVEGMSKPSDSSSIKDGKSLGKEKKKIPGDQGKHIGDKSKKNPDYQIKAKKDGSVVGIKKPLNPEGIVRKKIMMTEIPKTKPPEDRTNLKSAAKILSQKVMSRKTVHTSDKQKSSDRLSGDKSKDPPTYQDSSKRLSSFTIPKHKPVTRQSEEPVKANTVTTRSNTESVDKVPSSNGSFPLQKIDKYNEKVMIGVRQVLVEMYEDMMSVFESHPKDAASTAKDTEVTHQVHQLQLELDRLKWMHQQEIAELQHNHDLTIAEIRQSIENEKLHLLEEAKRKSQAEKAKAIEETKQKQWCANCGKEAIFYCCWNTSYCDYPCQQLHWPKHMATCSQAGAAAGSSGATAGQNGLIPKTSETDIPADTPTSPTDLAPEKEVVPKPVVEEEKEIVDAEEEDESDTEMMVIDESLHKEDEEIQEEKTTPDIMKEPVSPVLEISEDKIKGKLDDLAPEPPKLTEETLTVAVKPTIEKVVTAASTISTLASDIKPKPLPVKTQTSSSSNVHGTGTTVVPSKLLDDIFSKVLKKENIEAKDKEPEMEIANVKNSPDQGEDLVKKAGTEPEETEEKTVKEAVKGQHSGDAISAIGERLMKARQQLEESSKTEVCGSKQLEPQQEDIGTPDIEQEPPSSPLCSEPMPGTDVSPANKEKETQDLCTSPTTSQDTNEIAEEKIETEDENLPMSEEEETENMELEEDKEDDTGVVNEDTKEDDNKVVETVQSDTVVQEEEKDDEKMIVEEDDGQVASPKQTSNETQSIEPDAICKPVITDENESKSSGQEEVVPSEEGNENEHKSSTPPLKESPPGSPEKLVCDESAEQEPSVSDVADDDKPVAKSVESDVGDAERAPGPIFSDSYLSGLTKTKQPILDEGSVHPPNPSSAPEEDEDL